MASANIFSSTNRTNTILICMESTHQEEYNGVFRSILRPKFRKLGKTISTIGERSGLVGFCNRTLKKKRFFSLIFCSDLSTRLMLRLFRRTCISTNFIYIHSSTLPFFLQISSTYVPYVSYVTFFQIFSKMITTFFSLFFVPIYPTDF